MARRIAGWIGVVLSSACAPPPSPAVHGVTPGPGPGPAMAAPSPSSSPSSAATDPKPDGEASEVDPEGEALRAFAVGEHPVEQHELSGRVVLEVHLPAADGWERYLAELRASGRQPLQVLGADAISSGVGRATLLDDDGRFVVELQGHADREGGISVYISRRPRPATIAAPPSPCVSSSEAVGDASYHRYGPDLDGDGFDDLFAAREARPRPDDGAPAVHIFLIRGDCAHPLGHVLGWPVGEPEAPDGTPPPLKTERRGSVEPVMGPSLSRGSFHLTTRRYTFDGKRYQLASEEASVVTCDDCVGPSPF